MAATVVIYVLVAAGAGILVWRMQSRRDGAYKVEVNRIVSEVTELAERASAGENSAGKGETPEDAKENSAEIGEAHEDAGENRSMLITQRIREMSEESYRYVCAVSFLPVQGNQISNSFSSEQGKDETEAFFQGGLVMNTQELQKEIYPIYAGTELAGFLRMDIQRENNAGLLVSVLEISLLLLEMTVLSVLFYLRFRILVPFLRMQQLTYELSRGNLKGEIMQEKNRYFGRFEWSLAQLKDNLEVRRKRELELLKERKLLLLSLSHDIKTPLATIQLYNRALQAGVYDTEEKRTEIYRQIERKINEIESYLEQLLSASREELMDIEVKQGEFYLDELMGQVLSVYREQCELRKIELSVGTYENRLFKGDLHRLVEVFENIFENAFKYGDGRRIEISFYEEDYCQLIRVFNTGEPVAENDFAHLFESFFRGSNTRRRQGNGLGLYIAREILHKTGGEIFAESEENGMAFVVVLPM